MRCPVSGNNDGHEFRFSIVRIVIGVTNLRIVFVAVVVSKNLKIFENSGNLPKV